MIGNQNNDTECELSCCSWRAAGVSSWSARRGDYAESCEQYQCSPESSTGSLLGLIELNLLILENKLKICYFLFKHSLGWHN